MRVRDQFSRISIILVYFARGLIGEFFIHKLANRGPDHFLFFGELEDSHLAILLSLGCLNLKKTRFHKSILIPCFRQHI